MVQRVNFLRFASDLARKFAGITDVMLDLHLARLGVFMRKFLPFRWACAAPVLVRRQIFSMQGKFCHYGHETTHRGIGMTGEIVEPQSTQEGLFMREFRIL